MSVPQALIEFFRKEATEYLDRLDQLISEATTAAPDGATFLANSRALRGSATMTRLEGLPDLTMAVERIAAGLRDRDLQWDERLQFAVRGALAEIRALVARTPVWGEPEQRRCRTQSIALEAVVAGYLSAMSPTGSPAAQVVPISRFFPDDGIPPVTRRNPEPQVTLAQRFRADISAAADGVARESAALATSKPGPSQLALTDGVRRALMGLADVAESYGASSISTLATRMGRAPLLANLQRADVQGFAQLLMNRELSDAQLAQQVRQAALTWAGTPAPEPAVVPIESLLYRGHSAVTRARAVRDELARHWQRGTTAIPDAYALFEELSDLLDLAITK